MAAHHLDPHQPIIPIDEAEEFFDSFSKLNQALTKLVKDAIDEGFCSTHPSNFNEIELMETLLPKLKKEFPQYRVSASALKKVWETVTLYYNKIKSNPEFLDENKRVNIPRLINESISQLDLNQSFHSFHPYSFAARIGRQVAECCLIIDDQLPSIDHLTKLVWSAMQHLIPHKNLNQNNPTTKLDPVDAKLAYLSLSSNGESYDQLYSATLTAFTPYLALSDKQDITDTIIALCAKMRFGSLRLFNSYSKKTLLGIEHYLEEHIKRYKTSSTHLSTLEIVERVTSLYRLTAGISQDIAHNQLEDAVQYLYSLSTDRFTPTSPHLSSSIYAFINAEIIASKELKNQNPLESILSTLIAAFEMNAHFPRLNEDQIEDLTIWTYTLLCNEIEPNEMIEKEIEIHLIANPHDSFTQIVGAVNRKLLKIGETLNKLGPKAKSEVEQKTALVCHQNDMSAVLLNGTHSSLFQYVKLHFTPNLHTSLDEALEEMQKNYLKMHPSLAPHSSQVKGQILIAIKMLWYTHMTPSHTSNYHQFLRWQTTINKKNIENVSKSKLPLVPYRPKAFYSYMTRKSKLSQRQSKED